MREAPTQIATAVPSQGELWAPVCCLQQGHTLLVAMLRDRPTPCKILLQSSQLAHIRALVEPLWFCGCEPPCPDCRYDA